MGLDSAFRKISLQVLHQVFLGISLFQIYPYLHFKLPKRNCYQRFKVDKSRHWVVNGDIWLRGRNIHRIKEKHSHNNNNRDLLCCKLLLHHGMSLLTNWRRWKQGIFHGKFSFFLQKLNEKRLRSTVQPQQVFFACMHYLQVLKFVMGAGNKMITQGIKLQCPEKKKEDSWCL